MAQPRQRARRNAFALALARHRAHAARALSRRPPRPDREQPDVHDADRPRAAGDGDARRVQRLPDVCQFSDGAGEILSASAGARRHCQAGVVGTDAVRRQGGAAGRCRPGAAGDDGVGDDADDRPRDERHLARAPAAANRQACARLLGRPDARAVAARHQSVADVVGADGQPGLRRRAARRRSDVAQRRRVRLARAGHGRAVPLRAAHACALAPCAGRRCLRRHRHRSRQALARLVRRHDADDLGGVRRLCRSADPAALDLRRLADRALGRGHRRVRAEPVDAHRAHADRAGASLCLGAVGDRRAVKRQERRCARPGAARSGRGAGHGSVAGRARGRCTRRDGLGGAPRRRGRSALGAAG